MSEGNEGSVYIGGNVTVGRNFYEGDSVTGSGRTEANEAVDLSGAQEVIELDMRIDSITKDKVVYKLVGRNEKTGKWIMKKLTGEELAEHEQQRADKAAEKARRKAEKKAAREARKAGTPPESTLPSWESIKGKFPEGSIASHDFVGGTMFRNGVSYRLAQPSTQTDQGYVYIKVS